MPDRPSADPVPLRVVGSGEPGRPAVRPDDPRLADDAAALRSAYVHIPFCRRRCPYCDFAVVTPDEGGTPYQVTRYVQALIAEVGMEPLWSPLDAVNLGGGTPSSLPVGALQAVLTALRRRFGVAPDAEVSLEANPEDWDGEYAESLRAIGFTRVSLGVQSFDDDILIALGRLHDAQQAVAATQRAQAAGFASVSIDLIYGTPGESLESWRRSVEQALELRPDHLSAYSLTVERGTELSRLVNAGAPAPDPDDLADKYELLVEAAAGAGLIRYEVSNFARPGHHCRYNLATWGRGEYLAFGLGAHGHRSGIRRRNVRRLEAYLARIEDGVRPEAGADVVHGWAAEQERLMLGLRRAAGVMEGRGVRALLDDEEGRRLQAAGLIDISDGRLRVTNPLLTDVVVRAVLDLPEP